MIQRHMTLSEPEGECSDCSSYEELSSNSEAEVEEETTSLPTGHGRRDSESSYRSWYLRRGSKVSNDFDVPSSKLEEEKTTSSRDSLTVIIENQKTWWYWMKLAIFVSAPFIARQVGIIFGKRLLKRVFTQNPASAIL